MWSNLKIPDIWLLKIPIKSITLYIQRYQKYLFFTPHTIFFTPRSSYSMCDNKSCQECVVKINGLAVLLPVQWLQATHLLTVLCIVLGTGEKTGTDIGR